MTEGERVLVVEDDDSARLGLVELVRTWCLEGHGFTQGVDALAAWPVTQVARPLGTG